MKHCGFDCEVDDLHSGHRKPGMKRGLRRLNHGGVVMHPCIDVIPCAGKQRTARICNDRSDRKRWCHAKNCLDALKQFEMDVDTARDDRLQTEIFVNHLLQQSRELLLSGKVKLGWRRRCPVGDIEAAILGRDYGLCKERLVCVGIRHVRFLAKVMNGET